jgi:CheY-like chemotaxis protein/vacuolar-type H+-ATPase subunit F/Vma7
MSNPGHGSTFTLYLPLNFAPPVQKGAASMRGMAGIQLPETTSERIPDDRDQINRGDPVVLIVEDDPRFASILLNMAREAGFKGLVTAEGSSVVPLAKRYRPDAITLDIGLPDMDGFALLDLLKRNPDTRHIPIHVISGIDDSALSLNIGAYGVSGKPVERETILATLDKVKDFGARPKRLLAVEPTARKGGLAAILGNGDIDAVSASKPKDIMRALSRGDFDCIILDLAADAAEPPKPDVIEAMRASETPVIAYLPEPNVNVSQPLARLDRLRMVHTVPQMQDDAALFLHRSFDNLPEEAREAVQQLRRCDPQLMGRKVVVIDDDIRNIFSLTSALEEHGMELHYAESGRAGIELLQRIPDADVALVDIMMPGMDGYETIREIRTLPNFAGLPIVAVTAKAMKGDRQKCIEAGASDYVAKPVDMEQLVSVLRVWLQRAEQAAAPKPGDGARVIAFTPLAS